MAYRVLCPIAPRGRVNLLHLIEINRRGTPRVTILKSKAESMMTILTSFANQTKDEAAQTAVKPFANKWLGSLGRIEDLQLDSQKQKVFARLALNGESSPVEVTAEYRVSG